MHMTTVLYFVLFVCCIFSARCVC